MRAQAFLAGAFFLAVAAPVSVQAALTPGSGNVAVIEPRVVVPREMPCTVPLVHDAIFGAANATYSYTPPAACPGPWARVVLAVDVRVQKGIQYDRTGTLWMAGVPLWFGTTAEPTPDLEPSWHFERDVTEYSALFKTPQTGFELIANYTNSVDTSLIKSNAALRFYPPTPSFPAPQTPDLVLPLSAPGGGTVGLSSPSDTLSTTVTLPTNIKSANLEVYTQGQGGDEFWYTCVPNSYTIVLESCGGGAFREGEITVDGTPAGVAPVYPWIFTGGIDPYLWAPIPGVQTLSFTPFTVALSPFAGPLSNGAPHTIALSVYGDNNSFSAAGALLITLDPTTPAITGSVRVNTLAAVPSLVTTPKITTGQTATTGTINTAAKHNFTIVGEVMNAAGRVTDTVKQSTVFANDQYFYVSTSKFFQNIVQNTKISVEETNVAAGGDSSDVLQTYLYPLTVRIKQNFNSKGAGSQLATITQERQTDRTVLQNGQPQDQSNSIDTIVTMDTLEFGPGFTVTGHKNQAETAGLLKTGTSHCFERTLQAKNNVLISVMTGCSK